MNDRYMWNDINLRAPPDRTWIVGKKNFDVNKFISMSNKIKKDFESLKMLHTEAAILSRLIYRMKSKFRSDRGLKMMEKVNRALLNYLTINLDKVFTNFKDCIEVDDDAVKVPSKQMLQFLLIRIQGFAKLMSRAETVALNAAHLLMSRISMGHAWTVSKIAYSVISRIWVLLRHQIKKSCNWYFHLYEYLNKFKLIGVAWISDDYILPTNLKDWLNLPWIEEPLPNIPTQETLLQSVLNSIRVSDDEAEEGEIMNYESLTVDVKVKEENEAMNSKEDTTLGKNKKEFDEIVDCGERISRDEFESTSATPESLKKSKKGKKRKLKEKEQILNNSPLLKKKKKKSKIKN